MHLLLKEDCATWKVAHTEAEVLKNRRQAILRHELRKESWSIYFNILTKKIMI